MTQAEGRSREPIEMFNLRTPIDELDRAITWHQLHVAMYTLMRADIVETQGLPNGNAVEYLEPRRSRWHGWLKRF